MTAAGLHLHAMALPDSTPHEGLELASSLGFEGLELIVDDSYPCAIGSATTDRELQRIRTRADLLGQRIPVLSSYERRIGSPDVDQRRLARDRILRELDYAAALGAQGLRVLAGDTREPIDQNAMIDALSAVCVHAANANVLVLLENHMDTAATTARSTADIVSAVDSRAIGIVADPANLEIVTPGALDQGMDEQLPYVRHLHVKDFLRGQTIGSRTPVIPGNGQVPWASILPAIFKAAPGISATFEYEARWYSELPAVEDIAKQVIELFDFWSGRRADKEHYEQSR